VSSKIMTAATFRHELSRACDPQLHTHCVVPCRARSRGSEARL
jgi:hypothetical protein